jgi:hypothetical protein
MHSTAVSLKLKFDSEILKNLFNSIRVHSLVQRSILLVLLLQLFTISHGIINGSTGWPHLLVLLLVLCFTNFSSQKIIQQLLKMTTRVSKM